MYAARVLLPPQCLLSRTLNTLWVVELEPYYKLRGLVLLSPINVCFFGRSPQSVLYHYTLNPTLPAALQASSAATADDPTIDLSQLDVAAVMFDSAEPSSFRQAVALVVGLSGRAGDSLPIVLIAAKDDLGMSNVSGGWCG
jgi:hypothetical protein